MSLHHETAGSGVAVAGANAVKINMLSPDTLVADQEYLATFAAGTADAVVQKVARWAMSCCVSADCRGSVPAATLRQ
jgi:hypothetical protein